MKRLEIVVSIGLMAMPLAFGQNTGTFQSSEKVTTDDSVYKPDGGPADKAGKNDKTKTGKKDKSPGTPANGPIASPNQNPAAPPTTPKEGNPPQKTNPPEGK